MKVKTNLRAGREMAGMAGASRRPKTGRMAGGALTGGAPAMSGGASMPALSAMSSAPKAA
jgi:hypothetical protein